MKYKYNGQVYDVSIKALDSMPIGSIIQFAGENIPTGWLVCNGDVVSSTDYPDLFAEIGNKYGGTSPSFKLPDLRGRVPVGLDPTDQLEEFDILGNSGGSRYLQAHNHGGSTGGNYAYDTTSIYTTGGSTNFYILNWNGSKVGNDGTFQSKTYHAHSIPTDGTGDSGNLQPYLVVNFIIKAKNTTPTMGSIVNATNDSTEDAYSCDYINNQLKQKGDLVWTNPYGANAFSNKTITNNVSEYSYFEVYFYVDTNCSIHLHQTVQKGVDTTLSYSSAYTRVINIGNTSMTIHSGRYNGTQNDAAIIPSYIIGYK